MPSVKSLLRRLANRFGYHVRGIDDLTRLLNEAGSDKGWGIRGVHYYTRVYSRLLQDLRDAPITFVEIGLLRADPDGGDGRRVANTIEGQSQDKGFSAPSLKAWRSYFKRATIVGFDIDDFSAVNIPGTRIVRGDMSNRNDLGKLIAACPGGKIDVLIDDGSHASHHQQIAFATLFPHVAPGGLYIIEDCHYQDVSYELPNAYQTRALFQTFRRTGELSTPHIDATASGALAREIASVNFYDTISCETNDTEDALCVIRKHAG